MANELSLYTEVKIIGPTGSGRIKPERTGLSEAPLKPLPLFILVAFCKALWLALRWKPTIILAGSGLTAPLAWIVGKLSGATSSVYLHGFDITAPHMVYQRFWTPTFKKIDSVIVNSTPTKALALAAGVPEERIHLVYPGVSLPTTPQPTELLNQFRQKHGLEGKKVLLSIGRLTTRKGLREFVERALPNIVKHHPNAVLLIVGEAPKNSLGAGIQTVESIQAQAQESGVSEHIKFLGVITDQQLLATVYEASDLHIFPVRHIPSDPEGFGMVAIEAAAHGLPTVAFAAGGVVDAVRQKESGYLADNDDYPQLSSLVTELIDNPLPKEQIKAFARNFEWSGFGVSVLKAIN